MLYSYATKWIGGFSLMCATQSCRATLMTSLPKCKSARTLGSGCISVPSEFLTSETPD